MLSLEITFPSGRYWAARADAPDTPEWPPHPARLFSALVAAAMTGRDVSDHELEALKWLEQQAPPLIEAPEADCEPMPVSYVSPGDCNSQKGRNEHPCFRIRKPRHFPCAFIRSQPVVRYYWDSDPSVHVRQQLEVLCRSVSHVGTSHSFAMVRIGDTTKPEHTNWIPHPKGDVYLRVCSAGRLDELLAVFNGDLNIRRPSPACEPWVAYRNTSHDRFVISNPRFNEFVVFRLPELSHDATSSELLARALRRAVMSQLPDPLPLPSAVHGHCDGAHVAWLPLVDVRTADQPAAAFGRGRVMGMGVAFPRDMPTLDRQQLLMALGRVEDKGVKLPDGRTLTFELMPLGRKPPHALLANTWNRSSRFWASATPVVPDRLPRRQKSSDIEQAVCDSLERMGFPTPRNIEVSRKSCFFGAPPTMAYRMRLPRFHVVAEFPQAVAGPVIAGRLRYFGVGLLRPLGEKD